MAERSTRKHFSMIRSFHLADLFTIANGVLRRRRDLPGHEVSRRPRRPPCVSGRRVDRGRARVRRPRRMDREMAALDVRHGPRARLARRRDLVRRRARHHRVRGGANTWLDQVVLLFFIACGLSRLARFNVTAESLSGATGKVAYFEGTPIPDERGAARHPDICVLRGPSVPDAHSRRPDACRCPALPAVRHAHDQQDVANPQTLDRDRLFAACRASAGAPR